MEALKRALNAVIEPEWNVEMSEEGKKEEDDEEMGDGWGNENNVDEYEPWIPSEVGEVKQRIREIEQMISY